MPSCAKRSRKYRKESRQGRKQSIDNPGKKGLKQKVEQVETTKLVRQQDFDVDDYEDFE